MSWTINEQLYFLSVLIFIDYSRLELTIFISSWRLENNKQYKCIQFW